MFLQRFLLPVLLHRLPSSRAPLQNVLAVFVQLQLRDLHLARSDADLHALPVRLLLRQTLDVDDVFETVDGGDFAFAALVAAAHDEDFVVFADGD